MSDHPLPQPDLEHERRTLEISRSARYGNWIDWVSTFIAALTFLSLLLYFQYNYSESSRDFMFLAGLLGAALGWACGFVATPYNASESKKIGDVTKVASGIASGYVLAKLDRLFELVIPKVSGDQQAAFPVSLVVNTSICAIAFIIIFILTYVARSYPTNVFSKN